MQTQAPARLTLANAIDPIYEQWRQRDNIEGSTQFSRGWESSELGASANGLRARALDAYRRGDNAAGEALEVEANDLQQQSAQWAPTVHSFRDINSAGSAADWVGGALGGMRTSLEPLVGGLGGAMVGAGVGALTRRPALGIRAGAMLGATGPAYHMEYDEAAASAMNDQTVMARNSYEDIHRAAQAKGAINAGLEMLVPAGAASSALLKAGAALSARALAKRAGGAAALGFGEEALTEGAQGAVGQVAQNYLRGEAPSRIDYGQVLDEAMAGGVAGGGLKAGSSIVGDARALAGGAIGTTADVITDTARDPVGAAIAAGYKGAALYGTGKAKLENYFDSDEQANAALGFGRLTQDFTASATKEMGDEEMSTRYRGLADAHSKRTLTAAPHSLGGNEAALREAAAQYQSDGDWYAYREAVREHDRKQSRSSMMEEFDNGAKFSDMSMDKDELSNLAAAWQANEGKRYSWVFDESDDGKALSAKLFGWIKSGFGKDVNDGEVFLPTRMLEELGETAPKVIQSAISAARKEGWDVKDAGDIVEQVKAHSMRNSGDVSVLRNTLRYSQVANWNDQMLQRFAKEMRSKKGQMDQEDYKWLRSQFSDPEKLVYHFRSDSSYYKAPNKLKAPDSMKALEAELQGDADITEDDGDWNSGVSEIGAKTTRTYPTFETGEFFNLNDESQRQEFEKLSTEHAGRQNGSSVKRVAKVGIVDRTLEKLAEERGTTVEALAPQTRAKVMRDLVHEYFPKFERLGSKPKGVSELMLRDYERRKIEYEKGLQRRANLLNQKLVALAVEESDFEKLGTQISADDVHMKSADIRKPVYGPHKGTLIFQSLNRTGARKGEASTRPFVTSTQMLLAKMFQAKDSNGASTKEYEGTAQEMLQLLSDGVSSVLQDPRFGNAEKPAKIGTVVNGQRVWFDTADVREWPQNLVIFRDKAGRRYTLGEALEQERNQSEAKLTIDFDPDEIDNGRHDYVRPKTTWEMKQEMRVLLGPETTKETRAKIVMALRSRDDETIQELWQELVDDGALNSSETVTSIGSSRGDKAEEGKVGPDDLSAYDPSYIKRDERGFMRSSSTTLSAQSVVGTSKRVSPEDAAKFEPATRRTPNRAENKELATKREEARQTFIELLRSGMSTFTGAVKNMSKVDLTMFEGVHDEFWQQLSDYPHTIAKGYFGGNVDAARMLVSRFKKNATEIRAAISNRREEVNRAQERVERVAVEEPGREQASDTRGGEAGVASQRRRERPAEDRELGAGEQRRDAEAGGVRQNDEVDLAKQLQTYLDQYGAKNAAWARAATRALAENTPTQITGALAAAKKQFGELTDDTDLERHQMSKAVEPSSLPPNTPVWAVYEHRDDGEAGKFVAAFQDIGAAQWLAENKGYTLVNEMAGELSKAANLVDIAKPPAFAKAKEQAKLDGADYVFAPTGVDGSFASRLAEAAKGTGKLIDPNGTENIRDKVVYISVPGASRGFTGMEQFLADVRKLLDRGAIIRTDTNEHASRPHNAAGEGKLRQMLAFGNYVLTEGKLFDSWQKNLPRESNVTKQDAWVMRLASMSMEDMQAYVQAIPYEKLEKALEVLDNFNVNRLKSKMAQRVAAAAKSNVHYRLHDEAPVDGPKASEQSASDKPIDAKEAIAYLKQAFGQDFDAEVVSELGGKAGMWTEHGIKLSANAPDGTQFHEALHELFSQLRKHGAANVKALIERVATGPVMKRKLEQLLEAYPKALAQLKSPEEAAAFMFQFWNLGLLKVGPETKGLFETIKGLITKAAKKLLSLVDAQYRAEYNAKKQEEADTEAAFEALDMLLNHGKLANKDTRQAIYDALRKDVEAHDKAMQTLGKGVDNFYRSWGKLFVSNEAMLALYKEHPELKGIADKFHQVHGSAMKNQGRNDTLHAYGGFMEAVGSVTNKWMTRMERMLDGYDQKDLELALKYLETGKGNSSDPKIAKLVDDVRKYMGDMYDYMVESDVRRLDPSSEERWVPVERRTDYWTQVWDVESLLGKRDAFIEKLLSHHMSNLKQMADEANKEVAAWQKNNKAKPESPSAARAVESGNFETITPEAVAESIYSRLINSMGMIDIEENEWSMGITPGAAAVNRRQLNWLDKEAFSEFKSKDMVNIMTTYTRSMIKRGEYQKRFGYGGEVIAKSVDTAWLREMGGQELVDAAEKALPSAIKEWKQAAGEWHKDNPDAPYPEPYPTLRSVGVQSFRSQNGDEKTNEALINAETALRPAINSIRALEGTLGSEISPAMRNFNSWAVSYQNVRLLPFMLFTNLSDVIGITVQGGTLGDAWNAFVEGIRGIRDSWKGERNTGAMMGRAEEWGVVDAGALLDSLGQAYGSVYMSQGARRFNEKFFRVIGAEGWNRGIRAAAASVGERIILDWAKNGVDMKKAGEKERFERLFGEGADPKRITLAADGSLDTRDHRNRAAISRFVQDSVMTSNAAHRTAWMADPRYATFAHLKNFAYTFHRVMLLGILDQAKKGNLRPAAVAGLGYASIAIAGGALKEMLIPGDEPPWMKGGLDSYLEYGYRQAGLGGVPMMWLDSALDLDPAKAAGPMWDQAQNLITSPIPGINLNLSPFDGETEILKDRKVLSELTRALPAGNVLGRGMDNLLKD